MVADQSHAGNIFDPFAGGSVRGVVSAALGCRYVGVNIRSDEVTIVVRICALPLRMGVQVVLNQRQWRELLQGNLAWSSLPAPV